MKVSLISWVMGCSPAVEVAKYPGNRTYQSGHDRDHVGAEQVPEERMVHAFMKGTPIEGDDIP